MGLMPGDSPAECRLDPDGNEHSGAPVRSAGRPELGRDGSWADPREALAEPDGKLVASQPPAGGPAAPAALHAQEGQLDQLGRGAVIGGEPVGANGPANHGVETFDGFGGVDDLAD